MRLMDILTEDRVVVSRGLQDKAAALDAVAALLARGDASLTVDAVRAVLAEREGLQSTGIGEGIAIPHGFLPDLPVQVAALLVLPDGVPFESIDDRPATIIVGVLGPKRGRTAQLEHLRVLARVSKVLREPAIRVKILASSLSSDVFAILRDADERVL